MRHGDLAADGGNIDDAASAPDAHFGNDLRNELEGAPKMQSHRAFEILGCHMLNRPSLNNPGVVDQDIDLAKTINNSPDRYLNLPGVEQIAFNRENFAAASDKISLGTRQFVGISCNDSDIAASRANVSRKHEPESTRSTSDQNNFIVQRIPCGAKEACDQPEHQQKAD